MQNKSKQTICGIVCLIVFSCYLFVSEVFVFSYDSLGNVEIELLTDTAAQQLTEQVPSKDSQQIPHTHITIGHLYSLEEPETKISLIPPCLTKAFIQPQTLSIQLSENLPNAHLLLSHEMFLNSTLSKLSHTILLV